MRNSERDGISDSPYGRLDIHRRMMSDRVRVEAFGRAIARAVRPDDVVLDAGTGTGILAMLAVRAGAGKVYAVEPTAIIGTAERIIRANGMEKAIKLIAAAIENTELPEKVDLLMWEWIGIFGIDEGLLPLFLLARDRWLKPGGRMIPEAVSAHMAPAFDLDLERDRDFWMGRPYGLDYSPVWDRTVEEWHYGRHHLGSEHLAAAPYRLWSHDAYRVTREEACAPHEAAVEFVAGRAGKINCLALWFESTLFGDVTLTNAPGSPPTHWGRIAFPLGRPYELAAGTLIRVEFSFQADGRGDFAFQADRGGPHRCGLSVRVGENPWERHFDHQKIG